MSSKLILVDFIKSRVEKGIGFFFSTNGKQFSINFGLAQINGLSRPKAAIHKAQAEERHSGST